MADDDRKVPAALILPPGKFFFGYKYVPFDPQKAPKKVEEVKAEAFGGEGNRLKGTTAATSPVKAKEVKKEKEDPWAKLGGGNSLRPARAAPEVIDATMSSDDEDMDYGVDEDEDHIIEIDSD